MNGMPLYSKRCLVMPGALPFGARLVAVVIAVVVFCVFLFIIWTGMLFPYSFSRALFEVFTKIEFIVLGGYLGEINRR